MMESTVTKLQDSKIAEDDSPYLSIADFFSVISLTLIYIALTLSFSGQTSTSEVAVLSGAFSGTGPGSAVDPNTAYITVVSEEDSYLLVRLVLASRTLNTEIRIAADKASADDILPWLYEHMAKPPQPIKVVLYLDLQTAKASAHKLTNELSAAFMKKKFEVAFIPGYGG